MTVIERDITRIKDKTLKDYVCSLSEKDSRRVVAGLSHLHHVESAVRSLGKKPLKSSVIIRKEIISRRVGVSVYKDFVDVGDTIVLSDGRTKAYVEYVIDLKDVAGIL